MRITALIGSEEQTRDRYLGRLVSLLPDWLQPDYITILRIVLVLLAICLQIAGWPAAWQLVLLPAAALTDTIDGVLARSRQCFSRYGAYIDEKADYLLGLWSGLLVLHRKLLPGPFILLMLTPELGLMVLEHIAATSRTASRVPGTESGTGKQPNPVEKALSRLRFTFILIGFYLLLADDIFALPLGVPAWLFLMLAAGFSWMLLTASIKQMRTGQVDGTLQG